MSKYIEFFNYMRKCPQLANLWSVAATEDIGVNVILPQGSSPAVEYESSIDVIGTYICNIVPYDTVYEDFQINCYRFYDVNDSSEPKWNGNVLTLDEVQAICDWVRAQNDANNFPKITGKQIVAIECVPFVPQVRYVNEAENTVCYFITIRLYYVNDIAPKTIEYECNR